MISLVATGKTLIALDTITLVVTINVEGGGLVCKVYVGTSVHIGAIVLPCIFLSPYVSSSANCHSLAWTTAVT